MSSQPVDISRSAAIRDRLCDALVLDLVGPLHDHALADEVLPTAPSRWYLTGFLAPRDADPKDNADVDQDDELEAAEHQGADDDEPAERRAAPRARFPASMGLSVLVPANADALDVTVRWGDYTPEQADNRIHWHRHPRVESVRIDLPERTTKPQTSAVPGSGGLQTAVSVRPVPGELGGDAEGRCVPSAARDRSSGSWCARPPTPTSPSR